MDAYELAARLGRSADEIINMPMEEFNMWRAFYLIKREENPRG